MVGLEESHRVPGNFDRLSSDSSIRGRNQLFFHGVATNKDGFHLPYCLTCQRIFGSLWGWSSGIPEEVEG